MASGADAVGNVEASMLPDFREDGYLPEGLHVASESEVTFRFGGSTAQRRRLVLRLRRWVELARMVEAKRFLLDGSFVTAKANPDDVDAVVWLNDDFESRVIKGDSYALELEAILISRVPEELFAAEDRRDWEDWIRFFGRTREADGRRKGLVEVIL